MDANDHGARFGTDHVTDVGQAFAARPQSVRIGQFSLT